MFKYEGKSVADFVWNDQYIAVKRDNGSFEFFDRVNKETLYFTEVPVMDDFILIDNYLVYTDGENIGSYDLNAKKSVSIHVGAETYGFGTKDGKVIAFNKFGNGNNTTSIFVLNPADLKIETLVTESSTNVSPISSDTSYFIKQGTNIVLTEVGADGKFKSITMNLKTGEEKITHDNTLLMNEYIYANKDGAISVFSLNKKILQKTINITGEYFCPMYVEAD